MSNVSSLSSLLHLHFPKRLKSFETAPIEHIHTLSFLRPCASCSLPLTVMLQTSIDRSWIETYLNKLSKAVWMHLLPSPCSLVWALHKDDHLLLTEEHCDQACLSFMSLENTVCVFMTLIFLSIDPVQPQILTILPCSAWQISLENTE